jgi:hypothetical protein
MRIIDFEVVLNFLRNFMCAKSSKPEFMQYSPKGVKKYRRIRIIDANARIDFRC